MGIEDFTPDEWRKLHELVKEEQEFIEKSKEKINQIRITIKQLRFSLDKIIDNPEHKAQIEELIEKMRGELKEVSDTIIKDEDITTNCENKILRIIDVIGNG